MRHRIAFLLLAVFAMRLPAQPAPSPARLRALNNRILELEARRDTADRERARSLLRERSGVLRDLIETRPEEALSLAFAREAVDAIAAAFPDSAALLESPGEWRGSLEVTIVDDFEQREYRTERRLLTGHGAYRVYGGPAGEATHGDSVTVRGIRLEDRIAAAAVLAETAGPACSTIGPQSTAVIVVAYPGVAPPVSPATLYSEFFGGAGRSLDGYWRDASYGKTSAAGNVFGPYTLDRSYTCDETSTITAAAIAAADPDIDYLRYNRIFIVTPNTGCSYSGMSTLGCGALATADGTVTVSKSTLLGAYMTTIDGGVQLAAHEGGHALGLKHARSRDFGAEALGAPGASGTYNEYGDNFSPMGYYNFGHYPAQHKAQLGWLPAANVQTVQGAGTYLIQPLETVATGPQALKVERGVGSNNWLWLEYRQPIGNYESTLSAQAFSGVLAHYSDALTGPYTDLVDFTPGTTSWLDPALAGGQVWVDAYTNLSLAPQSPGSSGITVQVSYGTAPCTQAAPAVSLSPANPAVTAGAATTYTATIRNNDSAACGGRTVALSSTQPAGWTAAVSPASLALAPGQSATATLTETPPPSTLPATYAVALNAQDTSGMYSGSANLTVMAPAGPLSVAVSIPATVYGRKSSVAISATVSSGGTPAAGVAVRFTVVSPSGQTTSANATTGANGAAAYTFRVGPKDPPGVYSVSATVASGGQSATGTASFTVR